LSAPTNKFAGFLPINEFSPFCTSLFSGGRKNDWQEPCKFDCRLVRTILFFVAPHHFSLDIGEWPKNQILIPDWTNFHCPGATRNRKKERGKNH